MARSLAFHDRKTCIECGQPHRRVYGSWRCFPCDKAVLRSRQAASRVVLDAIKAGAIPKASYLPCHYCGGTARDYEHRNYLLPLDVQPACRSCNLMRGPAIWRSPAIDVAAPKEDERAAA